MRRVLVVLALVLATLVSITVLVNVRSGDALPPPDPALPITMRDGSSLPLGEVLDRLRRDAPLPGKWALATTPDPEPLVQSPPALQVASTPGQPLSPAQREEVEDLVYAFYCGKTFALARREESRGNLDQALALYQSVGEDEPGYGDAQRRIGWHILAKGKGQPARGVPYVQTAVLENPLSANTWHDLARVYSATLGLDLD